MKRIVTLLPLICGLMLGLGVLLGSRMSKGNDASSPFSKIKAVLNYVQQNYVDSVNADDLTDKTLVSMLQNLDPHSDYFTAEEAK